MSAGYTIFGVDDEEIIRDILQSMSGSNYTVETFDSAESCLERLPAKVPDLFLLDVGLPGLNGYDLCRKIRSLPETAKVPVVFISAHDKPSDILASYDAGGDDYIVKPFNPSVLDRQIANIRRRQDDKQTLLGHVQSVEGMAALVLANLDDYAVLIKFLRSLNECHEPGDLLELIFSLLKGYRLEAVVQIRLPGREFTISAAGENRPLEVAVISNVRGMGRIFEFKSRAAFNFEAITLLVNNMPLHDPDFCGRIRDNVLIAAECANAKLQAQQAAFENSRSKTTAADVLSTIQAVMVDLERKSLEARYLGSSATQTMLDQLARTFASLGLSEQQESQIDMTVRSGTGKIADIYDFGEDVRATLNVITQRLSEILSPPVSAAAKPISVSVVRTDDSELF